MKKIYLIRHAKSSWSDESLDDFSRPLNSRGKNDVLFMGKRLKKYAVKPDVIFCSPAKRAYKTAKELAKIIDYDKESIVIDDSLYESSYEAYLKTIHNTNDSCKSIFIVAHNPTITEVGERLSGAILTDIPSCAIVGIVFDVKSFKDICEESGQILFFDYPKKHY